MLRVDDGRWHPRARGRVDRARRTTSRRIRSPRSGSSRARWCTATGRSSPTRWSAPTRTTPSRWRWRPRGSPTWSPARQARGDRACLRTEARWLQRRIRSRTSTAAEPLDAARRGAAAGAGLAGARPATSPGPRSPGRPPAPHVELWRELVRRGPRDLLPGRVLAAGVRRLAARRRRPRLVRDRPLPRGRPGLLDGALRRRVADRGGAARGLGADPRGRAAGLPEPARDRQRRSSLVTAATSGTRVPVMGKEVDLQEFTRSDRTRHREKVRRCLDVFARMLRESRFDVEDPMTGHGDRVQPRRRRRPPGAEERRGARGDRQPALPDRARRSSTSRSTCCPAGSARAASPASRTTCAPASTRPRARPTRSTPTW